MGKQMTLKLGFDATVKPLSDGTYHVLPGTLRAEEEEDWQWFGEVMAKRPHLLPHRNRTRCVLHFHAGDIRARRRGKNGNWEIEMNSLADFMKSLEDF